MARSSSQHAGTGSLVRARHEILRVRPRSVPLVTVDREVFLDAGLSATARLLYIVVLAAADHVVPAKQIPALVGLPDGEAVEPFLQELDKAGLVDLGEHLGQPLATTVSPQPRPGERRSHPCVPCEGCGECSCRYMTGRCKPCDDADRAEARLRQEVARWKAQREAGATYAKGSSGARLHRWDCPSLENPDKVMARLSEVRELSSYIGHPRLPELFTAEELRAKGCRTRRCAICGPDPL